MKRASSFNYGYATTENYVKIKFCFFRLASCAELTFILLCAEKEGKFSYKYIESCIMDICVCVWVCLNVDLKCFVNIGACSGVALGYHVHK